jgi:DNA-binding SARP family transcriptional activator
MPLIEFRVLGPFEVSVEGSPLELKRRKQRALMVEDALLDCRGI